jgi:hypothetical protein
MATLNVRGNDLTVELSLLEKIGAISGGVSVPLSSVEDIRVVEKPYSELRGIRVGTGIPYVIVLGRMVYSGGKDFVAVYGTGPSVMVTLRDGQRYKRILLSGVGERAVDEIRAHLH